MEHQWIIQNGMQESWVNFKVILYKANLSQLPIGYYIFLYLLTIYMIIKSFCLDNILYGSLAYTV